MMTFDGSLKGRNGARGFIIVDEEKGKLQSSEANHQVTKQRRRQARLRAQARDPYHAPDNLVEEVMARFGDPSCCQVDPGLANAGGFDGVTKRREANARERLRVKNLNSGFAKLRCILPTVPPNRKPSKVDTLQSAIDYIHRLERLLEETGGVPDIGGLLDKSHPHSRQSVTECPFLPEQRSEAIIRSSNTTLLRRHHLSSNAIDVPSVYEINQQKHYPGEHMNAIGFRGPIPYSVSNFEEGCWTTSRSSDSSPPDCDEEWGVKCCDEVWDQTTDQINSKVHTITSSPLHYHHADSSGTESNDSSNIRGSDSSNIRGSDSSSIGVAWDHKDLTEMRCAY